MSKNTSKNRAKNFSSLFSGYGSQAVSSTTLSSEDSLSVRSISVDETPDTETHLAGPDVVGRSSRHAVAPLGLDPDTCLLSPPDVSLTSTSPGEDTDHTVTLETTPSSANITPSQSVELVTPREEACVATMAAAAAAATATGRVVRRRGGRRAAQNPNRSSCPTSLGGSTPSMDEAPAASAVGGGGGGLRNSSVGSSDSNLASGADTGGVSSNGSADRLSTNGSDLEIHEADQQKPEEEEEEEEDAGQARKALDLSALPDWMAVGESVQIRPSNNSGVIAYIGATEFAPGCWVGVELDTPQGRH